MPGPFWALARIGDVPGCMRVRPGRAAALLGLAGRKLFLVRACCPQRGAFPPHGTYTVTQTGSVASSGKFPCYATAELTVSNCPGPSGAQTDG